MAAVTGVASFVVGPPAVFEVVRNAGKNVDGGDWLKSAGPLLIGLVVALLDALVETFQYARDELNQVLGSPGDADPGGSPPADPAPKFGQRDPATGVPNVGYTGALSPDYMQTLPDAEGSGGVSKDIMRGILYGRTGHPLNPGGSE